MPARFCKVDNCLYRGGRPSKDDLRLMKEKFGVNRVVSLDGDIAAEIHPFCNLLDLDHVVIPIEGDYPEKNIDKLKSNIKGILTPKDSKTYVHCFHGKDRTGMACAMYRVANGMDVTSALVEAQKFGMGSGLSPAVKKMYYNAVVDFSKLNEDSNDSDTIVDQQREITQINNLTRPMTLSDMTLPQGGQPQQMSFAPYSAQNDTSSPVMNVIASDGRVYRFCAPGDLLNPDSAWVSRGTAMGLIGKNKNGKLYSAEIHKGVSKKNYKKFINKALLQSAKLNELDVAIFAPDVTFVINPNALVNIREEGDVSNIADIPLSGQISNYDGAASYSFPGSSGGRHGMLEDGSGGFAGPAQLPYGAF